MATHYDNTGLRDRAIQEYWALVNSSPLYVGYYLYAATLLIEARSPRQAWLFLESALQIGDNRSDTTRLLMSLIDAYLQNNEVAEARRILAQLHEINPKHPGIEKLAEKLKINSQVEQKQKSRTTESAARPEK